MKLKDLNKNKAFWLIKKTLIASVLMLVADYCFLSQSLDISAYTFALIYGVLSTVWEFYFPAYGKSKNEE
ncbi:hypothetical protein DF185_03830 [Marinifilum breve]|uniref:Uncharacterized protein n=1 Tax=Marinifilum breve TaxID=2184082 RepID=A0A2V4A4N4_9BACT|nr:hypothetical protein [Marinifilum breve]PXY03223.1 hypothetical protein DF185_03830 [Marinifilum breve]